MIIDPFHEDDESYILYLLEVHKRISNSELCQALDLSTSTVRKKLAAMESQGLLIRTHGGAASVDADRDETVAKKLHTNNPQKKAIAAAAARFLEEGTTLSFGSGTTILELSSFLIKLKTTVILTDSTMLASRIVSNLSLEVHINNGIVRGRTGCVVGPGSDLLFRSCHTDKAFIGCDSFSLESGACSSNILVGQVERCMLECAKERYILCDSTKLNQDSLYSCMGPDGITALITDNEANPEYIERLRASGLTVILAPVPDFLQRRPGIFNN